jgi:hypothetical protein
MKQNTKNIKDFIETSCEEGLVIFFEYLKKEQKEKFLLGIINLQKILCIQQLENPRNLITIFNKEYLEILSEKIPETKEDKELIKKMEEEVEFLLQKINEDFEKFCKSKLRDVVIVKNKDFFMKTDIKEVVKEKLWILNLYSNLKKINTNYVIEPVLFSKILVQKYINLINRMKSEEEMEKNEFEIILIKLKKHLIELKTIKLQKLTKEEKLCFYINIYNSLYIHTLLTYRELVINNILENQCMLRIINYIVNGKIQSLYYIKKKIKKKYKEINNMNEESVVVFSLCTLTKGEMKVKIMDGSSVLQNIADNCENYLLNYDINRTKIEIPSYLIEFFQKKYEKSKVLEEMERLKGKITKMYEFKNYKNILIHFEKLLHKKSQNEEEIIEKKFEEKYISHRYLFLKFKKN